MTGFLGALMLTVGVTGLVMLSALAANRLLRHQDRRDEERERRKSE